MAVQGAHLTSTAMDDEDQPSIFEILAQDSLIHSLQPALQHIFRILAESNPSRYGWLYQFSSEIYTGLHLILENYYLRHYNSSFSENFYGIKRVEAASAAAGAAADVDEEDNTDADNKNDEDADGSSHKEEGCSETLPLSNRVRSLLLLVLVPYAKSKCDALYERLLEKEDQEQAADTLKVKLVRAFLGIYPILHCVWESTLLAFQLAYIFGKARVHSPLLKLAGVILQNMALEDMQAGHKVAPLNMVGKSWLQRLLALVGRSLTILAITLSHGMSVGVFFLQFLEWWYASDQNAVSLTALPTPDPPQESVQPTSVPRLHTICPLCQRVRTNDTVLAVTGYVFCYTCIHPYVDEHSCCPVTGYPANMDHLVKLYLPDG